MIGGRRNRLIARRSMRLRATRGRDVTQGAAMTNRLRIFLLSCVAIIFALGNSSGNRVPRLYVREQKVWSEFSATAKTGTGLQRLADVGYASRLQSLSAPCVGSGLRGKS